MNRLVAITLGGAAVSAATWLWHAPLGTGERLVSGIEARSRATLDRLEMTQVQARVGRDPLSRDLILSGPADDFQRGELIRIMGEAPGVANASWDPSSLPAEAAR